MEAARRHYTVILESDEESGGFVATVPAFPGVADQGETEEEALENIRQALDFTIMDMLENGEEVPPSDVKRTGRRIVQDVEMAI